MRIGFIFPSSDYLFDPFRGDPFTQFQLLTILENNFGSQLDLKLIDLRGIKREFAFYHIPECDAYLHSVYTLDYEEQRDLVTVLRRHYPGAKHLAGGPHIMAFPEESGKIFDSLVFGEGEETIVQVVKDLQQLKPRLLYPQKAVVDINTYPYWNRSFLPKSATARKNMMTLSHKPGYEKLWSTTALFSRGCPYDCRFCAITRALPGTPPLRYRTPDNVKKEIEYLQKEYGIQGISLHDEIGVPLSRMGAIRHLEAIGQTGIVWRGQCRVDGLTPELAFLARQSGCVAMGLGVESVYQLCLDLINKHVRVEQSRKTISLLKNNDIEVRLYFILGLPGEPKDIVEKTWAFIEETQPDLVYLSLFTVRPGTEFFNHPEKFGIEWLTTDWKKTMHMYSRYKDEQPELTFRYSPQAPWGPSLSPGEIVTNYLELQRRLKERGLASLAAPPADKSW